MSWHTQTRPDFIVAAGRTAQARQIVSAQHSLIGILETSGKSSVNARQMLQVYQSSLRRVGDNTSKTFAHGAMRA